VNKSLIIVFLLLNSCYTTKIISEEDVIGQYQLEDTFGYGPIITLQKDNSFEFYGAHSLSGVTKGRWELDGTKVILNSEHQPFYNNGEKFEILELDSSFSDSLVFQFVDEENHPLPFARCKLKINSTVVAETETDLNGLAKFPIIKADSLIGELIGLYPIRYKLDKSATSMKFIMSFDREALGYRYFTDEVYFFKKERLYNPLIKRNKYIRKPYYQRFE